MRIMLIVRNKADNTVHDIYDICLTRKGNFPPYAKERIATLTMEGYKVEVTREEN